MIVKSSITPFLLILGSITFTIQGAAKTRVERFIDLPKAEALRTVIREEGKKRVEELDAERKKDMDICGTIFVAAACVACCACPAATASVKGLKIAGWLVKGTLWGIRGARVVSGAVGAASAIHGVQKSMNKREFVDALDEQ